MSFSTPRRDSLLTQLAANADTFLPDSIPDSCSEASDNDVVAISPPTSHKASFSNKENGFVPTSLRTGPSGSRTIPTVEATVGRGGKVMYTVARDEEGVEFFAVQWRKPQTKKVKTWDGDAFLKVTGNRVQMVDDKGDVMASGSFKGPPMVQGCELRVGQYETEVDRSISAEEFKAETSILNKRLLTPSSIIRNPATMTSHFKAPLQFKVPRPKTEYLPARTNSGIDSPLAVAGPSRSHTAVPSTTVPVGKTVSAASFYASKPKVEKIVIGEKSNKERLAWGGALHDPGAPGAVVMPRPPDLWVKLNHSRTEIIDVVLDPLLTSIMRPHQHEGVKASRRYTGRYLANRQFMYKCVMGMSGAEAEGCILADEMGLGKTLQTIGLIYTMLKQSPFANQGHIAQKILIVCPVTLVSNWRKEFKKWLQNKVGVVAADGSDWQISNFLRKVIKQLASCQPPIELIVCDEGHRLKSKDNKTTKMFEALRTSRRIILSGTPVQNDLGEYWAMVNFTCPGILGTYPSFNKRYEKKILRSRMPGASKAEVENGMEQAAELSKLSEKFVLRRTADVLSNYLPPRHDYVIFVAPATLQLEVFSRLLNPSLLGNFLRAGSGMMSLALIDSLRKVSNSPSLLRKKDEESIPLDEIGTGREEALKIIPKDTSVVDLDSSGKLIVLVRLLQSLRGASGEKVVVVSNWTSTLDFIEGMCKVKSYSFLRLDGKTPTKTRQTLVEQFNRGSQLDSFVFLLSAKAGGVGLNLIGASRLVLFDSDWNPSTDRQAMGRIHRDGQKKPVYIYRFLTACTIDEKIYQRQITKDGLSDQMLDGGQATGQTKDSFTLAELRDIFTLNTLTDGCQTHDLLGCDCADKTAPADLAADSLPTPDSLSDDEDELESRPKFVSAAQYDPAPTPKMIKKAAEEKKEKLAALKKWTHIDAYDKQSFRDIADTVLYNMLWEDWDNDDAGPSSSPSALPSHTSNKKARLEGGRIKRSEGSDSEESTGGKTRKNKSGVKIDIGTEVERRHDLRKLADNGQGGRVLYVFEKVKKSKMLQREEEED
ncbi:hypothetical protein TREMEDRAFT_36825 [Tremella mesenterica DSM 1558]|uniref:uncharacterized protein n=1 Tax=Tremella mesenterica (strain ATCC 24925 / CBS 8224 / DSM 1558 / NBRC 9311 / NRRL Y-6157 / RJB 2259-6 / UBC 559-6) TaxID=578456 RepID=UPI0003F4935D|nr:uncharacterized protein TREMEDRAFT_36825 [Tremella mesenterica DSM 1558]EIW72633.1 hypothetical protein TREMEDRAFT_36825 [Tremella mesenterica DSM 1558]